MRKSRSQQRPMAKSPASNDTLGLPDTVYEELQRLRDLIRSDTVKRDLTGVSTLRSAGYPQCGSCTRATPAQPLPRSRWMTMVSIRAAVREMVRKSGVREGPPIAKIRTRDHPR